MGPDEAARLCGQAAATLTQAMSRTTDPSSLTSPAVGLRALAPRLGPEEAAQGAALTQAMARTIDPYALHYLAGCLSALGADEAAQAAATLAQAMARATDPSTLRLLAAGLRTLAAGLGPEEAAQSIPAVTLSLVRIVVDRDPRKQARGIA
jgi:hypothetical protein